MHYDVAIKITANEQGLAFVAEFEKRQPGLLLINVQMFIDWFVDWFYSSSRNRSRRLGEVEHLRLVRRHNAKPTVVSSYSLLPYTFW